MENLDEEKMKYWETKYGLKNLRLAGYGGGYPIISFDRDDSMPLCHMSERSLKRVVRMAENGGGVELGVGWSLRKTAYVSVNEKNIVICGHEYVIDRILERVMK